MGFHREECGSTAVEYGILVAALGVGLVAVGPALADAVIAFLDVVLDHVPGVS